MASIIDVARHAGVSVATVSKVINNYPNVSDKTRKKVNASIDRLKYRPNVVARGLVKKRSWTVGILLHNMFTNPFVSELLVGIQSSLYNSGYDLIYLSMMMDDPNYSFIKHCYSRNVDGIIVFGLSKENPQLMNLLAEEIPTMFVDTDLIGRRAGYITADNSRGIFLAVEHLHRLNHRKIAFITGQMYYVAGRSRFEGYQQGIKHFELPYHSNYVAYGDFSKEGAYEAMINLLKLPEPPTAVICTSDLMAIGAIEAVEDQGLSVPNDVSVIGFDNTIFAEIVKPGLTTVSQNVQQMGRTAMEHLISMIDDPNYSPPVLVQPVELIVRQSTAPIKVNNEPS